MKQSLVFVAFFVVAIYAETFMSEWPQQFSTGFDTQMHRSQHNVVGRWFYDSLTKMERIDVTGEWGYDTRIFRYDLVRF